MSDSEDDDIHMAATALVTQTNAKKKKTKKKRIANARVKTVQQTNDDDDEEEEEYEVEKVINRRLLKGGKPGEYEYEVKWKDYPASQNTWERLDTLADNAMQAVLEYEAEVVDDGSNTASSSSWLFASSSSDEELNVMRRGGLAASDILPQCLMLEVDPAAKKLRWREPNNPTSVVLVPTEAFKPVIRAHIRIKNDAGTGTGTRTTRDPNDAEWAAFLASDQLRLDKIFPRLIKSQGNASTYRVAANNALADAFHREFRAMHESLSKHAQFCQQQYSSPSPTAVESVTNQSVSTSSTTAVQTLPTSPSPSPSQAPSSSSWSSSSLLAPPPPPFSASSWSSSSSSSSFHLRSELDDLLFKQFPLATELPDESNASQFIWFYDLEIHNGWPARHVCQITGIRADALDFFDEYVFHAPLHRSYQDMIMVSRVAIAINDHLKTIWAPVAGFSADVDKRTRPFKLKLSPWDDPEVAVGLKEAMLRWLSKMLPNTIIIHVGTNDPNTLVLNLYERLGDSQVEGILNLMKQKNIMCASLNDVKMHIESLFGGFSEMGQDRITEKNGTLERLFKKMFAEPNRIINPALQTKAVFENAFVNDYTVLVDGLSVNRLEEKIAPPFPARRKMIRVAYYRHSPVWHTSHTDALITMNIAAAWYFVYDTFTHEQVGASKYEHRDNAYRFLVNRTDAFSGALLRLPHHAAVSLYAFLVLRKLFWRGVKFIDVAHKPKKEIRKFVDISRMAKASPYRDFDAKHVKKKVDELELLKEIEQIHRDAVASTDSLAGRLVSRKAKKKLDELNAKVLTKRIDENAPFPAAMELNLSKRFLRGVERENITKLIQNVLQPIEMNPFKKAMDTTHEVELWERALYITNYCYLNMTGNRFKIDTDDMLDWPMYSDWKRMD